jgi:hypothetical protein
MLSTGDREEHEGDMKLHERFIREFGELDWLTLWDRVASLARAIPDAVRRYWRTTLLADLGLPEGTSEHLNSVAVTAFARLCRRALAEGSTEVSVGEISAELEVSLRDRGILLAWSAAEGIPEAVDRLAESAARALHGDVRAGLSVVGHTMATRRLRSFDGSGSLGAWLRTVSSRLAMGEKSSDSRMGLARLASSEAGPEGAAAIAEEEAAVRRALAALPPDFTQARNRLGRRTW